MVEGAGRLSMPDVPVTVVMSIGARLCALLLAATTGRHSTSACRRRCVLLYTTRWQQECQQKQSQKTSGQGEPCQPFPASGYK